MAWAITADVGRFEEALASFLGRTILSDADRGDIPASARSRAFWIAGVAQLDVVEYVHERLSDAIAKGTPFETFRKDVAVALKNAWGEENNARVETIFRNATQTAYNAGRFAQMTEPSVLKFRPFWLFDAILDSRTTPICKDANGTLLAADDSWWDTHYPPLHHRCRSSVRNIRRAEAEERGGTTSPPQEAAPQGWGFSPRLATEWRPNTAGKDAQNVRTLETKVAHRPKPAPARARVTLQSLPQQHMLPLESVVHDDFVERLTENTRGISASQRQAIASYTGADYSAIRDAGALTFQEWSALPGHRGNTEVRYEEYRRRALECDAAVKKFGGFAATPQVLFRGVAVPKSLAETFVNGQFAVVDRITSASRYFDTAAKFADDNRDPLRADTRVVFVIRSKKPTNTLPVEHLSALGPTEGEVMLGVGKRFKIDAAFRQIVDGTEYIRVDLSDTPEGVYADPKLTIRLEVDGPVDGAH